ncbi:hypothetical protein AB4567_31215, partial [Vibrio sp. 10N.222.51.A6]
HYADNHNGIFIELERNEQNELGNHEVTRKVKYTKSYPSLNTKILLEKDRFNASLQRDFIHKIFAMEI